MGLTAVMVRRVVHESRVSRYGHRRPVPRENGACANSTAANMTSIRRAEKIDQGANPVDITPSRHRWDVRNTRKQNGYLGGARAYA